LKVPELEKGCDRYVIAHRGGSMESPENTLQAFAKALRDGAHMLETDVRMSKDGVIMVCHDDNFQRLCGDSSLTKDTEAASFPLVKDSLPLHFSKGQHYHLKESD